MIWHSNRYKNNHISPTELEAILQRHPAVREALVFGFPDPQVQELITAVVVPNTNFTVSKDLEEDLVKKQRSKLF